MAVSVFFEFNGNASKALEFYKSIFGGEVYKMTYGDIPADGDFELPDDKKALVAYASLDVKGTKINLSDVLPEFGGPEVVAGNNVTAMFSTDNYDEGKKIYDALLDKGNVIMPFEPTFWAKGFGELVDQFGVQWKVNVSEF